MALPEVPLTYLHSQKKFKAGCIELSASTLSTTDGAEGAGFCRWPSC